MSGALPALSVDLDGRLGSFSLQVSLSVPPRGITGLFGPSACGKTTVLRCIAGLATLPGRIALGDAVWQDSRTGAHVPPHRRRVGIVFQEASLFLHLSVRDNLRYGAKRTAHREAPGAAGRDGLEFDSVTRLLGLAGLLDRAPDRLSGGERQRVAIGRALLSRPHLLLMDEPLVALDQESKEEILHYLETLHRSLAMPVIYVSHDLKEIERLADWVILMRNGRVEASGPLRGLQTDARLPLAHRPDAAVSLDGIVTGRDEAYRITQIDVGGVAIAVAGLAAPVGSRHRIRIPASAVVISRDPPTGTSLLNVLPARVLTIAAADEAEALVVVALGAGGETESGAEILARATRRHLDQSGIKTGDRIFASI